MLSLGICAASGSRKTKKVLRQIPKIHPSQTKQTLGVSNFSQVRSILLQQQDAFSQQVAEFQRLVVRQKLTATRPHHRAALPNSVLDSPKPGDVATDKIRARRDDRTSAFHETTKKSSAKDAPEVRAVKKPAQIPSNCEDSMLTAKEQAKYSEEEKRTVSQQGAETRKRSSPAGEGSPLEESEAKRRPESYHKGDIPANAPPGYDASAAAMAAYSYHQHIMHQMAAAGMVPPPGLPSPASFPPAMDPYAMQYLAAMQNPSWYFGYGGPSSSSRFEKY
mmetsp:Transcript_19987/g.55536  ORF Transcript_19987/g.55536 Transcript_19987/m.55536 type:complete len:277 (+) Transcript_19987:461-1291(+)